MYDDEGIIEHSLLSQEVSYNSYDNDMIYQSDCSIIDEEYDG